MSVELVSVTLDAENLIVSIARVSSPNPESRDKRLLTYLIEHGHWSPFEHAHMTVRIETSRAIAAQLLRHRSFVFQEFSQRYADVSGFVPARARRQAEKNRQSSIDDLSDETREWWDWVQRTNAEGSFASYRAALNLGIARETARFLLPLGTCSMLYMTGSFRSWIHYCELRCRPDTQEEHRELAYACRGILAAHLPSWHEDGAPILAEEKQTGFPGSKPEAE